MWDLDLQDFQAAEARERLSRDVREAVPREAPANQREERVTLAGGPAGRWPHAESRDAGGEGGGETALLTSQGPPLAEEETEAQFSVWASPRPDYLLGHVHPQPALCCPVGRHVSGSP